MCDAVPVRIEVRTASDADAPAIVEVLEQALGADPFVQWLCRGRAGARRAYFEVMLSRIALPKGVVHVATADGAIRSVALWAPPGSFELGIGESLFIVPAMMRIIGPWRFVRVASLLEDVDRARPPEPRWLLTLLGTAPGHRRGGLGGAVLAPALARCDADGTRAVCETSVEDNLRFYGRHGFVPTAERTLGRGGPRSFTLWREPARGPTPGLVS